MSRYRLTIAVALTLTASFRLYAQWSESFTRAESDHTPRGVIEQAPQPPPASFVDVAQQVLPDVGWLRNPGYTLQRGRELLVFAGSAEPNRDAAANADDSSAARRIKLAPFALIWFDAQRPQAPPLVVQCDSARIQFENPVELGFNAPNPGRVTAAWFDGLVEITGPDGLHLRGENFSFSEESLNLYSPFPIAFTYGPTQDNVATVRGAADEVLVSFTPTTDPTPDPGMPRIGGIQRLRLRKQIVLDCNYEVRRGKQPPQPASAHISCDDFLEFDAETSVATLLKNVFVRQPTGGDKRPDEADTLRCHQLSLHLVDRRPTPAAEPAVSAADAAPASGDSQAAPPTAASPGGSLRGLRVDLVEARGSDRGDRVRLQSDAQHVTADMQLLQFDVATGAAVLSDPAGAVQVVRDGTQLRSQVIRVTPDPQTGAQAFTCLGRGLLQQPDPDTGDPLLEATWNERLHAAPDPNTGLLLVQLDQEVRLIVQHRAGILADHLNVWIDESGLPTDDSAAAAPLLAGPGRQLAAASRDRLPIRYVEARGGVILASSEMRAETEVLQAVIEPGTLPYTSENATQLAGDERPDQSRPQEPWHLTSQNVFLKLLNAPQSRDVQVAEAHADGNVEIVQAAPAEPLAGAPPEAVSLAGAHLELVNQGENHQVLTITGAPALMRRGDFLLECRNLQVDRAGNRATVLGAGLLQAPVGRDLNGAELEQPMILDVKWEEGLTFDGRLAAFRKAVKLQLHDSVLQCDEMDVRLDQPLSFVEARPHAEELLIRDVSCRNGVQVEIYDWRENRIVGIRKGRLTQFVLDYQTGEFVGDGPGKINHWSLREGRRVAIASRRTAQANVPVASESLEWEHISVDFDDLLRGNFKERTAELHGRVRTIYAPVRRISETFTRDDLSGGSPSVEHAVWLGCDTMNIELHPVDLTTTDGEKRTETRMVIAADGRCELEGRLFFAKADSLSYEEEKMLFTLRGKGDREASIYYQEPGAEPRRIPGQIIQFVPSEGGKVRLEGSRGFQGSP